MGSHLLTETLERRPDIGLGSYDRLFPNQDTLPKGGFGNLIALPLQKQARDRGNSVFLNDAFEPHQDQWAFLASVRKISRAQTETLVQNAESRGRVIGVRVAVTDPEDDSPWTTPPSRRRKDPPIPGPLPETLDLVLGDQIYVAKENLPPALRNRLLRLAAFQNPEFYRAQSMRLSTYGKPRIIDCAEDHPKHIALPHPFGDGEKVFPLLLNHVTKIAFDRLNCKMAVSHRRNLWQTLRKKFESCTRIGRTNRLFLQREYTAASRARGARWLLIFSLNSERFHP